MKIYNKHELAEILDYQAVTITCMNDEKLKSHGYKRLPKQFKTAPGQYVKLSDIEQPVSKPVNKSMAEPKTELERILFQKREILIIQKQKIEQQIINIEQMINSQ